MKKEKCVWCNKRLVNKQDWKSEEENTMCLTCWSMKQVINNTLEIFINSAGDKGIDITATLEIRGITKADKKEKDLLKAIGKHNNIKWIIKK